MTNTPAPDQSKPKRAKYDPTIENHKDRILHLYCVENWTPAQIRDDLSSSFGIEVNEKQVSLRIGKWGGRKRLRKKEWIDAKTLIGQRKTIGKDTELILNNSIIIAGKRLKKGLSRNHESFTDRVFREVLERSVEYRPEKPLPKSQVEATTPLDLDQLGFGSQMPRYIPISTLERLPIYISTQTVLKLLNSIKIPSVPCALVPKPPAAHIPAIKNLLFKVSNSRALSTEVYKMVDTLNHLGYMNLLKQFLLIRSASAEILCEGLLFNSVLYEEHNLRDFIWSIYPHLEVDYYNILDSIAFEYKRGYFGFAAGRNTLIQPVEDASKILDKMRKMMDVINQKRVHLESPYNAALLLEVSFFMVEDVRYFYDNWDPQRITAEEIEMEIEEEDNRNTTGSMSRTAPLASSKMPELHFLLTSGFQYGLPVYIVRAIVMDNPDNTMIFLISLKERRYSQLVEAYMKDRMSGLPNAKRTHIWDRIGVSGFSRLLAAAIEYCEDMKIREDQSAEGTTDGFLPLSKFHHLEILGLLLCLVCRNPDFLDFALGVFEFNYPLHSDRATNALMMVDCFVFDTNREAPLLTPCAANNVKTRAAKFFGYFFDFWKEGVVYEDDMDACINSSRVIMMLFDLGAHPGETSIWKQKMWLNLIECAGTNMGEIMTRDVGILMETELWIYSSRTTELRDTSSNYQYIRAVELFLHAGADIEQSILNDGLSQVWLNSTQVQFPIKPIEVAFGLPDPDLFLLLISKGASIDCFISPDYLVFGHNGKYISQSIRNALTTRREDIDHTEIRRHWNTRIQMWADDLLYGGGPKWAAIRLLDSGDVLGAKGFYDLLQSNNDRIALLPDIIKAASPKKFGGSRRIYLDIIKSSFKAFEEDVTDDSESNLFEKYELMVSLHVIPRKDPELLSLCLLDNAIIASRGKSIVSRWVRRAAYQSIKCLKVLLGWWGNSDPIHTFGQLNVFGTALHAAVDAVNLDTATYLLELGADIYARGSSAGDTSPLEQAILGSRIDILSLFFQVEPECHAIAWEFAQTLPSDSRSEMVQRYIKDWSLEASEKDMVTVNSISSLAIADDVDGILTSDGPPEHHDGNVMDQSW